MAESIPLKEVTREEAGGASGEEEEEDALGDTANCEFDQLYMMRSADHRIFPEIRALSYCSFVAFDFVEAATTFVLEDFLENIKDSKLRDNLREVIIPPEKLEMKDMIGRGDVTDVSARLCSGCLFIFDL